MYYYWNRTFSIAYVHYKDLTQKTDIHSKNHLVHTYSTPRLLAKLVYIFYNFWGNYIDKYIK